MNELQQNTARAIVNVFETGRISGNYAAVAVLKGDSGHLSYGRSQAALNGELDDVETELQPILKLKMPKSCPGVDANILNPRNTWADAAAYDRQAEKLRDMFRQNFESKGFAKFGIEARI